MKSPQQIRGKNHEVRIYDFSVSGRNYTISIQMQGKNNYTLSCSRRTITLRNLTEKIIFSVTLKSQQALTIVILLLCVCDDENDTNEILIIGCIFPKVYSGLASLVVALER